MEELLAVLLGGRDPKAALKNQPLDAVDDLVVRPAQFGLGHFEQRPREDGQPSHRPQTADVHDEEQLVIAQGSRRIAQDLEGAGRGVVAVLNQIRQEVMVGVRAPSGIEDVAGGRPVGLVVYAVVVVGTRRASSPVDPSAAGWAPPMGVLPFVLDQGLAVPLGTSTLW